MALKSTRPGVWLSRFHFLLRVIGLTGLVLLVGGLAMAHLEGRLVSLDQLRAFAEEFKRNAARTQYEQIAQWLIVIGGGAVLLGLLFEAIVVLGYTAKKRSVFGFNVVVQVLLALAVLVGINYYSFEHYTRVDCTRPGESGQRKFTLPEEVRTQLKQLRGDTTIVVVQQRRKAFDGNDEMEDYEAAAENVVIDKVRDLVEQLRDVGPQFKVIVLDAKKKDYRQKLAEATQDAPQLAQAIKDAPDNSIFFYHTDPGKRVSLQRLSFNDFYQLDRTRSREADNEKGNLVLLEKGIKPFVNRILNLEQKRPRVGVLVQHELLTTQGSEDAFTLKGLRSALEKQGFEVRDIVLRRFTPTGPVPAVDTFDESRYEALAARLRALDRSLASLEKSEEYLGTKASYKIWQEETLEALTRRYARQLQGRKVTEEMRRSVLADIKLDLDNFEQDLARLREARAKIVAEQEKLNVDLAALQRRMTDLKAKMQLVLEDVDLIFLPRMTILPSGQAIPYTFHRLDPVQAEAIKDFLKSGKPLLACFGPANEPQDRPDPFMRPGDDEVEAILADLYLLCGKQTVLFDEQSEDFAVENADSLFRWARLSQVPPLDFQTNIATLSRTHGFLHARDLATNPVAQPAAPNPVRESLRLAERARGENFDIRLRYPRPIYYDADRGERWKRYRGPIGATLAFANQGPLFALTGLALRPLPPALPSPAPEYLLTVGPTAWNDARPYPTAERPVPTYEKPKPTDPTLGTPDEMRRGPFPIGAILEASIPREWKKAGDNSTATVRVGLIGHGGLFTDPKLTPAREKLLLDTCNWLLGREDLLTQESPTWAYPRVKLGATPEDQDKRKEIWEWGARAGLPLLFVYLGFVVLLARRVR